MISVRIGSNEFSFHSDLEKYFDKFRNHTVGHEHYFSTPYGQKRMIYADWTAAGRLYRPIENKLINEFGPYMANTHTESNTSGSMMTRAYKQAQKMLKKHVNADEHDVIIMSGSGMTSVINKFQRILGLKVHEKYKNKIHLSEEDIPVIFITHMEHHSNHTSWLETIGEVVIVPPNQNGEVCVKELDRQLDQFRSRKWKIGSFTACSNVSGIVTPFHELAKKMHEYGGWCFVDFAASAPYVKIDMHPEDPLAKLDAIFFSPHKFLGGPGSSGLLIFDSRIYKNNVPDHPGGGTVTWTNPWGQHSYFKDIEVREDGGTPGILQSIRAALCIELKERMGTENILAREKELLDILLPRLRQIPGLHILDDNETGKRLGMVSFYVDDIHYNLMVKLLNDRYGYQVRGGCSCAGTYGHYLLNIDEQMSKEINNKIDEGDLSIKPGWVRVSIHPTMTNQEVYDFTAAVAQIVEHISELKKDYRYDPSNNDFYYIYDPEEDMRGYFRLDD